MVLGLGQHQGLAELGCTSHRLEMPQDSSKGSGQGERRSELVEGEILGTEVCGVKAKRGAGAATLHSLHPCIPPASLHPSCRQWQQRIYPQS